MILKEKCTHPEYALQAGENMPLVYGSSRTQVCTLCGSWRPHSHNKPPNDKLDHWRDASEYEEAIKEKEVW